MQINASTCKNMQIYKGKGAKEELTNQRNIHTKVDVAKLFGHMVTTAAKDDIIDNMTKFQLGTKPGHRAEEHLFSRASFSFTTLGARQ